MTVPHKGGAPRGLKTYFSKVKEAREALKERSVELIELQMRIITEAIAEKDFETAAKANQFLLEHAGEDEDGVRILDISVDKPKEVTGYTGPSIQIGFALGGMGTPKALPEVIEVTPTPTEENE